MASVRSGYTLNAFIRVIFLVAAFEVSGSAWAETTQLLHVETTPFRGSVLYAPNDGAKHPGVIVFHGSEGGSIPFIRLHAQYLAMHGYVALAYCYFDCGYPLLGTHQTLANVELDEALRVFQWLSDRADVKDGAVAFYGVSRGAEMSILLASLISRDHASPVPSAVVSHAAPNVAYGAWNFDWADPRCWLCSGGACPPQAAPAEREWSPACGSSPLDADGQFVGPAGASWNWRGTPIGPGSAIALELYPGPVLITHGDQDQLAPVSAVHALKDSLAKAGRDIDDIHVFEGEGHVFSAPAETIRWDMVLEFLARELGGNDGRSPAN